MIWIFPEMTVVSQTWDKILSHSMYFHHCEFIRNKCLSALSHCHIIILLYLIGGNALLGNE